MVLDDLGLVPTLRRAARDRGRHAGVPVEFESMGQDQRLPMDLESGLFRILDEALAAYLGARAERVSLKLDWSDRMEARLSATRATAKATGEPVPEAAPRRRSAAGTGGDDGGAACRRPRSRRIGAA